MHTLPILESHPGAMRRMIIKRRRARTTRAIHRRIEFLLDRAPCPENVTEALRLLGRLHRKAVRDYCATKTHRSPSPHGEAR